MWVPAAPPLPAGIPSPTLARLRDELAATKCLVARLEGELVRRRREKTSWKVNSSGAAAPRGRRYSSSRRSSTTNSRPLSTDFTRSCTTSPTRIHFGPFSFLARLRHVQMADRSLELPGDRRPDQAGRDRRDRNPSRWQRAVPGEHLRADRQGRGHFDRHRYTYRATQPKHPRLTFLSGSSTDPNIIAEVKRRIAGRTNVFVILDSDHHCNHVLNELRIYSELVPINGYLVVEDTDVNGHPAYPEFGPGPREAVDLFLRENSYFEVDRMQERFYLSQNPRGFCGAAPRRVAYK